MREKLGIAAIVAFLVVDLVLVTLAVRHVRDATPPPAYSPVATASAGPAPADDRPDAGSAAPFTPGAEPIPDDPILLALAEDGTVMRAVLGSCESGIAPRVEVSTDGGASFESVTVDADLGQVLGLEASGRRTLRLGGLTTDCEPVAYEGAAGRDQWRTIPSRDAEMWHLVADAAARVHAPSGEVETPCPVASLTVVGSVRALCDSGRIIGTADDGESWVALGDLPGGVAIGYVGPGIGYALAEQPDCPAAVMSTGDGGVDWTQETCLGEAPPRDIAARGDVVLAQVGDQIFRSEDAAATWTKLP